ncbi:ATP-binding protein [Rhizorhapis suberifaciens]|uniref:ATP-binding protein n=1 Tax=Rhizorhapis suberifaciens TaxID=13656 RepID=UPI001611A6D5|nr:hypothetical protein [Rhizorhapis suberifaciens]
MEVRVFSTAPNNQKQTLIFAPEAQAAFGEARIYVEPYIPHGRHVEVQILGDGTIVIHLGTRDCSIQRQLEELVRCRGSGSARLACPSASSPMAPPIRRPPTRKACAPQGYMCPTII